MLRARKKSQHVYLSFSRYPNHTSPKSGITVEEVSTDTVEWSILNTNLPALRLHWWCWYLRGTSECGWWTRCVIWLVCQAHLNK